MIGGLKNETAVFLLAVQFLTRLPLPADIGFTPERQSASVRYYPLIGILIGCLAGALFWGAHLFLPVGLAVLLSTAAICLLTGAFHEDGLADTFDGIGGGLTRERSLAIMKDSRIGTYGAAALGLTLAIKVATLSVFPAYIVVLSLIAGHGLSRLSAVLVIATSRYVRDHGTGKPTADGLTFTSLIVTIVTGGGCFAGMFYLAPYGPVLGGAVGVVIGHIVMRLFFERKLGGYTGDTLGAVQQISEIGFYLGVAACL